MRIKKKFLQLTKQTYPKGTESQLEKWLPSGYFNDSYGNYYIIIGDSPTTMFTCHLDTVSKVQRPVKHLFKDNFIYTDGTTTLGADDKAGMVVLLYMIEKNIPGIYSFFLGEESGCLGSKDLSENMESGYYFIPELKKINKVVSFDRKGTNSIITEQLYTTCCSNQFAEELAKRLNEVNNGLTMKTDDSGFSTDSAQFIELVPECTNISVGYYGEHTMNEKQDIQFLYRLCEAVVKIDWETLPVVRDPKEVSTYSYSRNSTGLNDWDAPWDNSRYITKIPTEVFGDRFDRGLYTHMIDPKDDFRKLTYISRVWVYHEEWKIREALKKQGRNIKDLKWDGTSCWLLEHGHNVMEYIGGRKDISIYLDKFGEIPEHHILFSDDILAKWTPWAQPEDEKGLTTLYGKDYFDFPTF